MPTYLVHGFRWPRHAIRIHIALYDLDDAAAEWIVAPASAITLLNSFYTLYDFLPPSNPPLSPTSSKSTPTITPSSKSGTTLSSKSTSSGQEGSVERGKGKTFNEWSIVKLLEQYDLADETSASQPYAYVADYIVPIALSVDIAAETAKYEERMTRECGMGEEGTGMSEGEMKRKSKRVGWFDKLRDGLAKGQSIGWFVVVVGDEERGVEEFDMNDLNEAVEYEEELRPKTPRSAGLRGFFGRREKVSRGSASEI